MSLFSRQQIRILSSTSVLLLGLQSGVFASEEQLKVGISPQGLDKLILAQNNDVLVPNPQMSIDGKKIQSSQVIPPPSFRRPVAPPVGDMAVSNRENRPMTVNLGTSTTIPSLVLRDAPVKDVLSLLTRSAGLNIVFAGEGAGPTITLDLQDEPVQDVFNYVLMISGLNATRQGNVVFIGETLPANIRNTITRSLRLNQYSVANAARFLNTLGASGSILTGGTTVGETEIPDLTITELAEKAESSNYQALKGLTMYADPINNTIVLVGEPELVNLGTSYLTQLDLRRRQVALNVKIVDISLGNDKSFGADFSFGVDNTSIDQTGGSLLLNFLTGAQGANLTRDFAARIQTTIATGNGKILTDPTLIVQEGQQAQVKLTQEVFGGFQTNQETVDGVTTITREPIIKDAGITLDLDVNKIDDNGFVTVNLRPIVSGIAGSQNTAEGIITLTQERSLESGLIRLRDGQTLVLSGIIQDTDRSTVSKVPILGDLPLLGSLFRFTNNVNERNEVIVLVTPNILDDSEASSASGYNYNPSRQTQEFLQEKGVNIPGSGFKATPQQ